MISQHMAGKRSVLTMSVYDDCPTDGCEYLEEGVRFSNLHKGIQRTTGSPPQKQVQCSVNAS